MTVLSESEAEFIDRRSRLIRLWPYAGAASLVVIASLAGYLLVFRPLLINPFYVLQQVEADSIPDATLLLMAAITPLAILCSLLVLLAVIALAFAGFANERKLITLIKKLAE